MRYISGGTLMVDYCSIYGFRGSPGRGIDAALSTTGGTDSRVNIDETSISLCTVGLQASNGSTLPISNSIIGNNPTA